MKIFLSYPSAHKEAAENVCYELQAEGHEVFFDKEDLPAGRSYNERIRDAVEGSDLLIFMITPGSVAKGKYSLTELKIARKKWPNPTGRVLPVMLEPTPFEEIPAYLKAVTILTPEGNLPAEIVMEIADLAASGTAEREVGVAEETTSFSYQPLEIRFGKGDGGTYPVSVTGSPVGSQAAEPCPIDAADLERILWSSAGRIEGTVRRARLELGETSESLLPSADDAKRVGERLYAALFASPIRPSLEGSLRSVDAQRGQGLRFLINTTEAPDLARLPWEFLYSPEHDDFLFSDQMKPVIRWLDVDQPPPTLSVQPPLRLLVAIASPADRPELSVGEEIGHLDRALRDLVDEGLVETVRLEHATLEKLDDALLKNKPHVLHFIGHGDFVGDEGVIVLEAETPAGAGDPISGRQLGVLLRNHLGSLRFVFLNSCLGAAVSVQDPFGGVAQSLIQRGIPAVIAMQFPIPDRVAIALARHFYRYLAAGLPVDTALTSARAFLFAGGHGVEWGAPALHMRTPDGRLFDVGGTSRIAPVGTPPIPETSPTTAEEKSPGAEEPPESDVWVAAEATVDALPAPAPIEHTAETTSGRRSNRGWWIVLALLLGLSMAAIWLSFDRGLNPTPSADGGGGPDSATTQSAAEEAYREAVAALEAGNVEEGLEQLDEARQADADLSLLAGLPAVRSRLLDALVAEAGARLEADDLSRARFVADELLQIAPRHPRGLELREEIERRAGPIGISQPPLSAGRTYEVARGDSLWTIAGSTYGDPGRWPLIFEANRDQVADPDLIFPDQQLVTPPLPVRVDPLPAPDGRRVEAGDSLWRIASEVYGDPLLWPILYEANRDRIQDPDLIFPNQVLVIPPRQRP